MAGENGYWFKCKGCGRGIGFFPNGKPPHYPAGSVGHEKPNNKLGVPNSVPCDLFNRLDADQLAVLHQDAEPLPTPTDMTPFFD